MPSGTFALTQCRPVLLSDNRSTKGKGRLRGAVRRKLSQSFSRGASPSPGPSQPTETSVVAARPRTPPAPRIAHLIDSRTIPPKTLPDVFHGLKLAHPASRLSPISERTNESSGSGGSRPISATQRPTPDLPAQPVRAPVSTGTRSQPQTPYHSRRFGPSFHNSLHSYNLAHPQEQ